MTAAEYMAMAAQLPPEDRVPVLAHRLADMQVAYDQLRAERDGLQRRLHETEAAMNVVKDAFESLDSVVRAAELLEGKR